MPDSLLRKADLTALEARLYKFLFTAMSAQTVLLIALIELLR